MYNVKLDENGFFTGTYATVGSLKDGVAVETLPPSENSTAYQLKQVTHQVEKERLVSEYFKYALSDTNFLEDYVKIVVQKDETTQEDTADVVDTTEEVTEADSAVDEQSEVVPEQDESSESSEDTLAQDVVTEEPDADNAPDEAYEEILEEPSSEVDVDESQDVEETTVSIDSLPNVITTTEYEQLSDELKASYELRRTPQYELVVISEEEYEELDSVEQETYTSRIKVDENKKQVVESYTEDVVVIEWVFSPDKLEEYAQQRLQKAIEEKKVELGNICTTTIYNGIDVELSDGIVRHFSLETKDQIKLNSLYLAAQQGSEKNFWHSDKSYCEVFSSADMLTIGQAVIGFISYHETLINHLNRYVESLTDVVEIEAVKYSQDSLQGEALQKFATILQEMSETISLVAE